MVHVHNQSVMLKGERRRPLTFFSTPNKEQVKMNLGKIILSASILTIFAVLVFITPVQAARNNAIGKAFLVNSTADEADANIGDGKCKAASKKCTLRAAIQESNMLFGFNTILVPAGEYKIANSGLNAIKDNLTIRGEGIGKTVIDGNNAYRIFNIVELNGAVDVTLEHMTIQNGYVSGLDPSGGAISNAGTLTLDHVRVADSHAKSGGGIYNQKTLHVRYSTIEGNAAARGGGISNGSEATADIFASTISHNNATYAGGIDNYGGALYMVNSTVAYNEALADGGGIVNVMQAGKNNYLDLRSVTVSRNVADSNVDNTGNGGGIFNHAGATVIVFDTILAQNVDKSIVIDPSLSHHDCDGELSEGDYGYNLLAVPNGCSGLTNGQKGDQVGTTNAPLQAKLNDLADNGGPTQTMLPMSGSPVIDAGDPGNCSNDTNGVDQRRYARVVGNKCDLGAVEFNSACLGKPAASIRFTPTEGKKTKKTQMVLKWLGVDCAGAYEIMVRRDAQNGPKVAKQKNLGDTSYTVSGLAKGHTYFWQVKACNDAGCAKSEWYTFKVKP
jgi:CSLREA domain-containing protein